MELDYEETSDVAYAIKHHLEYMIDTHWKNYPAEFWKREAKLIRIAKELLSVSGTYHVAERLDEELKQRLIDQAAKDNA